MNQAGILKVSAGVAVTCLAVLFACSSSNSGSGFGNGQNDGGDGEGGGNTFGGGPSGEASPCVGLQCQQVACGSGDTTVSGTVFAPNGTMPLYNVIVYVPNTAVDPLPQGVSCDQCGSVASGSPVVTTLSNADGTFTLKNVPVGSNIPLVFQLGKWRRQVTIPNVAQCTDTHLSDPNQTRLPKMQSEGDMPHIALTTGGCDSLGCMLPHVGIDPSEFGNMGDGFKKAINVYRGADPAMLSGGPVTGATDADPFWSDANQLKNYDMVILSCECEEAIGTGGTNAYQSKSTPSFQAITNYLSAGGRIFTTDFMYTWYKDSPDPGVQGASQIQGGAPPGTNPLTLDTSFPKGAALGSWLKVLFPTAADVQSGKVTMDYVFANYTSTDQTKTQTWARSEGGPNGESGQYPRVMTLNVPVGVPVANQCGKGVHIDAHVNNPGSSQDDVGPTYPASCKATLNEGEAMLAFFFFDLASCIQNDSQPPPPPPVK